MRRTKKPILPTEVVEEYKPGTSPKLYNAKMAYRILELAKLGLTQKKMAIALDVSVKTIESWLRDRKDCRDAYDRGKFIHDHGVQSSLLKRALGYEYEEVKIVDGIDSIGRPYRYTTTTTKVVLPDVPAITFWLKNRDRENWTDTQHHNISTTLDVNINNTLKLDSLTDQQREMVQAIALKQLSGTNGLKK